MPAFKLDAAELTGIVAYIRNMNTFDASSMKAGNAANGQTVFEGKGACLSCHRVNNTRQPQSAGPVRHRRGAQRRIARAIAARSDRAR